MMFSLIVVAIQIAVALFTLIRESGDDPRFEDKLGYRS
jgi:hypothetical protein